MEQLRKKRKRVSKILVDAEPRYVSIVDHAANLTPFKDVKMDKENNPDPLKAEDTANTVGDTAANVCKKEVNFTSGSVVKEFVFGESFKSEQDVKDYMDRNSWTGYNITKVEGGFVATGDYEGVALKDEKIIPLADDVSVCVAKTEDAEEKKETTEEKKPAEVTVVEKREEPAEYTQKYEAMLAYGNTMDEALASGDAFNKMPVGFFEMFETFYNVLDVIYTNVDIVDKDTYLKKACADFADILVKLNALSASLIKSDDLAKKEAGEQWLNAIKNEKGLKMAEQKEEIVEATAAPAEEAAPAAPAEAPAAEQPAAEPAAEVPAEQPEAPVEAPVAPAEPEAAPAGEQPSEATKAEEVNEVAELRKSVEELRATIAELTSKAQKAEDSGADAEASPTKKSENFEKSGCASEQDAEKAKAKKAEQAEILRSQLAGFFGCY